MTESLPERQAELATRRLRQMAQAANRVRLPGRIATKDVADQIGRDLDLELRQVGRGR